MRIPVSRSLADRLAQDLPILRQFPETARVYLPAGEPQREGSRLVQPISPERSKELAASDARAFYEGAIAKRICDALGPAGSPLEKEDFAAYRAEWVKPIATTYRGFEVFEMPPNTRGFAALQILNLLEGFDVAAWGFGYDVQQAIEAPRWLMGRAWGTASRNLSLESRIPDEVARELTLRGQPVQMVGAWSGTMGHAQAIRIDRDVGFLEGGADPRSDGAALGF